MSSSIDDGRPRVVSGDAFTEVQHSEKFQELRRRHRSFVFPVTAIFLAWYFLYVLLADYAHDFMSQEVFGNINVGLLLGLRAVRVDVRHHDALRPLREQEPRPGRRGDPRTSSRGAD